MRNRRFIVLPVLALLAGGLLWVFLRQEKDSPSASHPEPAASVSIPDAAKSQQEELIGEKLLQAYASEDTTIHDDLESLSRLGLSYRILVKTHASRPIGCNGDLADALRGNNPYQQRFLPDGHPVFNPEGQLQDRWGTPLFIHILAADQWEIRSAGPDREMWTDDDVNLEP